MNKTKASRPKTLSQLQVILVLFISYGSALKRVGVGDDPTSYWSLKQISASTVLDIVSLLS